MHTHLPEATREIQERWMEGLVQMGSELPESKPSPLLLQLLSSSDSSSQFLLHINKQTINKNSSNPEILPKSEDCGVDSGYVTLMM